MDNSEDYLEEATSDSRKKVWIYVLDVVHRIGDTSPYNIEAGHVQAFL